MYGAYQPGFGTFDVPDVRPRIRPSTSYTKSMSRRLWFLFAWLVSGFFTLPGMLSAQTACANTPAYSTCEMVFELSEAEAAAHADPYVNVDLKAEFRSPRHRTFLQPAFWDGGRRLV